MQNNILHSKHKTKNPKLKIYYNSNKCLLVFVTYISLLCFIYLFIQKADNDILKKASWPKFFKIIVLLLLKLESVGCGHQQINLVSI